MRFSVHAGVHFAIYWVSPAIATYRFVSVLLGGLVATYLVESAYDDRRCSARFMEIIFRHQSWMFFGWLPSPFRDVLKAVFVPVYVFMFLASLMYHVIASIAVRHRYMTCDEIIFTGRAVLHYSNTIRSAPLTITANDWAQIVLVMEQDPELFLALHNRNSRTSFMSMMAYHYLTDIGQSVVADYAAYGFVASTASPFPEFSIQGAEVIRSYRWLWDFRDPRHIVPAVEEDVDSVPDVLDEYVGEVLPEYEAEALADDLASFLERIAASPSAEIIGKVKTAGGIVSSLSGKVAYLRNKDSWAELGMAMFNPLDPKGNLGLSMIENFGSFARVSAKCLRSRNLSPLFSLDPFFSLDARLAKVTDRVVMLQSGEDEKPHVILAELDDLRKEYLEQVVRGDAAKMITQRTSLHLVATQRAVVLKFINCGKFSKQPHAVTVDSPEAGIGKTEFVNALGEYLFDTYNRHMKYSEEDALRYRPGMYDPSSEFQETIPPGCNAVTISDFGQSHSDQTKRECAFHRKLVEAEPTVLNRAMAEEKGLYFIQPHVVLATSNDLRGAICTGYTKPSSGLRRCGRILEPHLYAKFKDANGRLSLDKVLEEARRQPGHRRLENGEPDLKLYPVFETIDLKASDANGRLHVVHTFTHRECLKFLKEDFIAHMERPVVNAGALSVCLECDLPRSCCVCNHEGGVDDTLSLVDPNSLTAVNDRVYAVQGDEEEEEEYQAEDNLAMTFMDKLISWFEPSDTSVMIVILTQNFFVSWGYIAFGHRQMPRLPVASCAVVLKRLHEWRSYWWYPMAWFAMGATWYGIRPMLILCSMFYLIMAFFYIVTGVMIMRSYYLDVAEANERVSNRCKATGNLIYTSATYTWYRAQTEVVTWMRQHPNIAASSVAVTLAGVIYAMYHGTKPKSTYAAEGAEYDDEAEAVDDTLPTSLELRLAHRSALANDLLLDTRPSSTMTPEQKAAVFHTSLIAFTNADGSVIAHGAAMSSNLVLVNRHVYESLLTRTGVCWWKVGRDDKLFQRSHWSHVRAFEHPNTDLCLIEMSVGSVRSLLPFVRQFRPGIYIKVTTGELFEFNKGPQSAIVRVGATRRPVHGVVKAPHSAPSGGGTCGVLYVSVHNPACLLLHCGASPEESYAMPLDSSIDVMMDRVNSVTYVAECAYTGFNDEPPHPKSAVNTSEVSIIASGLRTGRYKPCIELIPLGELLVEKTGKRFGAPLLNGRRSYTDSDTNKQGRALITRLAEENSSPPAACVEYAAAAVTHLMIQGYKENSISLRPYSFHEMLNGNLCTKRLSMKTAMGGGYRGKKANYFDVDDDGSLYICDTQFAEDVDVYLSRVRKGEVMHCETKMVLKEEVVRDGKEARPFYASDILALLAQRMYLAPILDSTKFVPNSFIGVGLNLLGRDAHEFHSRFTDPNFEIVQGDYSKFDISLPSSINLIVTSMIYNVARSCGYADLDLVPLRSVLATLIRPRVNINGDCIEVNLHPSGTCGTSPSGGMKALTLIIAAACEIDPRLLQIPVDVLVDSFRAVVYGDDHVVAVRDALAKRFNQQSLQLCLASHGIGYTDPDKSDTMPQYADPRKLTFLKREFGYNSEVGYVVAPLERAAILKPMQARVKSSAAEAEVYCSVARSCLLEALLHGREFYDFVHDHLTKVSKLMPPFTARAMEIALSMTYEQRLEDQRKRSSGELQDLESWSFED